ncbi:hypothetical protein J6590_079831 [Homalodisca vitripennis]|nr:hypothetical protein J6590_079831 [Homalodisca vitripennis]
MRAKVLSRRAEVPATSPFYCSGGYKQTEGGSKRYRGSGYVRFEITKPLCRHFISWLTANGP